MNHSLTAQKAFPEFSKQFDCYFILPSDLHPSYFDRKFEATQAKKEKQNPAISGFLAKYFSLTIQTPPPVSRVSELPAQQFVDDVFTYGFPPQLLWEYVRTFLINAGFSKFLAQSACFSQIWTGVGNSGFLQFAYSQALNIPYFIRIKARLFFCSKLFFLNTIIGLLTSRVVAEEVNISYFLLLKKNPLNCSTSIIPSCRNQALESLSKSQKLSNAFMPYTLTCEGCRSQYLIPSGKSCTNLPFSGLWNGWPGVGIES